MFAAYKGGIPSMKVNKLLIEAELGGAWHNIEFAKHLYTQKHRNKMFKALKDAQQSLEFIQWHLKGQKTTQGKCLP